MMLSHQMMACYLCEEITTAINYGYAINGIIDRRRKNIKVKWFVTENLFNWHLCDTAVNRTLHSHWEI